MKRLLLGAAAAAMTLTGAAAQAQSWRGHDNHGYDRSYGHDWNRNGRDWRSNDRGWDHNNGWDGESRAYSGRWRSGQVYPYYARHDRLISDWGRYHLPPPRAGYGYYSDDNGDVVMAALASGLIGMVIGNAISDNGYSQSYTQPYAYSQPYYGYGYQQYGYPY